MASYRREEFTEPELVEFVKFLAVQPNKTGYSINGDSLYEYLDEKPKRFPWANRHSGISWRNKYKKAKEDFDKVIRRYQKRKIMDVSSLKTGFQGARKVVSHNTQRKPANTSSKRKDRHDTDDEEESDELEEIAEEDDRRSRLAKRARRDEAAIKSRSSNSKTTNSKRTQDVIEIIDLEDSSDIEVVGSSLGNGKRLPKPNSVDSRPKRSAPSRQVPDQTHPSVASKKSKASDLPQSRPPLSFASQAPRSASPATIPTRMLEPPTEGQPTPTPLSRRAGSARHHSVALPVRSSAADVVLAHGPPRSSSVNPPVSQPRERMELIEEEDIAASLPPGGAKTFMHALLGTPASSVPTPCQFQRRDLPQDASPSILPPPTSIGSNYSMHPTSARAYLSSRLPSSVPRSTQRLHLPPLVLDDDDGDDDDDEDDARNDETTGRENDEGIDGGIDEEADEDLDEENRDIQGTSGINVETHQDEPESERELDQDNERGDYVNTSGLVNSDGFEEMAKEEVTEATEVEETLHAQVHDSHPESGESDNSVAQVAKALLEEHVEDRSHEAIEDLTLGKDREEAAVAGDEEPDRAEVPSPHLEELNVQAEREDTADLPNSPPALRKDHYPAVTITDEDGGESRAATHSLPSSPLLPKPHQGHGASKSRALKAPRHSAPLTRPQPDKWRYEQASDLDSASTAHHLAPPGTSGGPHRTKKSIKGLKRRATYGGAQLRQEFGDLPKLDLEAELSRVRSRRKRTPPYVNPLFTWLDPVSGEYSSTPAAVARRRTLPSRKSLASIVERPLSAKLQRRSTVLDDPALDSIGSAQSTGELLEFDTVSDLDLRRITEAGMRAVIQRMVETYGFSERFVVNLWEETKDLRKTDAVLERMSSAAGRAFSREFGVAGLEAVS